MFSALLSIAVNLRFVVGLAPLEPPDGQGIHFGPWYDRLNGDTPSSINARFDYKPFSFFQSDMNISSTLQTDYIDNFVEQVEATGTTAFIYMTLYPYQGFEVITDGVIEELAQKLKKINERGRKVMLRFGSEMNGSWFPYGQKPTEFKAAWIKIFRHIKRVTGNENVAFVWAPNQGNGYPFPKAEYSAEIGTEGFDSSLDTNQDGLFDEFDDPYSPYYPGDEYVDWVGFSIYSYGSSWAEHRRWESNDIPLAGKANAQLRGLADPGSGIAGNFDFYRMFCGDGVGGVPTSQSAGNKPFFITETGAAIHLAAQEVNNTSQWYKVQGGDPESRKEIKQAWWRQLLDQEFLDTHPKIKAMSTFEFIKFEEATWRDFTNFGKYSELTSVLGNDGGDLDGPTLEAAKADLRGKYGKNILWAQSTSKPSPGGPSGANTGSGISARGFGVLTLTFLIFAIKIVY